MKYKIGDKVKLKKGTPLYKSSTASSYSTKTTSEIITNITRIASGAKHPYNTTGDRGWCDENYILPVNEDKKYEVEIELTDKSGLIDYLKGNPDKIIMIDSKELKDVLEL